MICPICKISLVIGPWEGLMEQVETCSEHGVMRRGNVYTDAYMSVVYPDLELVSPGCYLPKNRAKGDVEKKLARQKLTYINCGCDSKQATFLVSLQDIRFAILECSRCHVKLRIRREANNTGIAVDVNGRPVGRFKSEPGNGE